MHVTVCNFCCVSAHRLGRLCVCILVWLSFSRQCVCMLGWLCGWMRVCLCVRSSACFLCGYKPVFLSRMSFLLIYLWVCTLKYLCACSSMHLSVFTICCMCCARCKMEWLCWLIMWRWGERGAWVVMCMFTYACLLECPCVRMSVCLRFFNVFSMYACVPSCLCVLVCLYAWMPVISLCFFPIHTDVYAIISLCA